MDTVFEMIERVRAGEDAEEFIAGRERQGEGRERRSWRLEGAYRAVFGQGES